MIYIKKNLLPDEKIIFYTKPHYIIFSQVLMWLLIALFSFKLEFGFLITSVLFLATILSLIGVLISYYCSEYVITNRRIVMKVGFIKRRSLEIFLNRVEAVYIDQSVMGRILNYGTVTVIGIGGTENSFPYIPKPLDFRNEVQTRLPTSLA